MNKPLSTSLLAAAALVTAWLVAGCAAGNAGAGSSPSAARGSSVEVFGVIDAGVSHTTTKSGR